MLPKYVFVAFFALVIPLNAMLLPAFDVFTSDPIESPEQRKQREQKDYEELLSIVQKWISEKQDLNQPIGQGYSRPPLLKACIRGDQYLPITQLLLANKANPNVTDRCGETPLHDASRELALATTRALLSVGANPKIRGYLGTPLHTLCDANRDEIYSKQNAINRIKIVKLLLKAGADPNECSNSINSCLHNLIAKSYKYLDSIYALKGNTPEQCALFKKQRKALIRTLLEFGGSLSITNTWGTPIQQVYKADLHPKNKKLAIEFAQYALAYSAHLRQRLLSLLGHSGAKADHITPFRTLPKDIVNLIIDWIYPPYVESIEKPKDKTP